MISAVISTYNRDKYLTGVLDSLLKQSLSYDQFEIVLVNNNSTDQTEIISKAFEAQHPEVNFLYFVEKNQGLSHARNRGILESKGDYIAFVDDDAYLCKDYLKEVVEYMDAQSETDAIGGKILLQFEGTRPKWANKYLDPLWAAYNAGEEIVLFKNDSYPIGCNMAFRSSVFEKIGNFNVNLGRVGKNLAGGEEKDMFMRMYQKNMKVAYLPKAYVYHNIPESRMTKEFIRKQAIGVGASERIRSKEQGSFGRSVVKELIKWVGSFGLFLRYSIKGQFAKARMIIQFRAWVSYGLFKKHE